MSCVKTHPDRKRKTYRRRPRNITYIDGTTFVRRSLGSMVSYLWANGVDIDPALLKLMYAHMIVELTPNQYGKIPNELKSVYEDALKTINEYSGRYMSDLRYRKFLDYLQSAEWRAIKNEVLKIRNTKARLKFGFTQVNFMLEAYFRTPTLKSYFDLEQKYAGWSVKLWSKKSFWLTAYLFMETYGYIRNLEQQKNLIVDTIEWGESDDSLLLKEVRAWYEQKGIEDPFFYFTREFNNFLLNREWMTLIAGEVGSVAFTQLVRRGVVSALSHLAHGLFILASFHPSLRLLSLGGKIAWIGARLLDRSILAFFGWQIGLEWVADGWIQAKLTNFLERLGFMTEKIGGLTKDEIKELVDLMIKLRRGTATPEERQRFQQLLNNASPNLVNSIYNRLKMWEYVEKLKGLKTINETDLMEEDLKKFKRYNEFASHLASLICSQKGDTRPEKFYDVVRRSDVFAKELDKGMNKLDVVKVYFVDHFNKDCDTGSITPHLEARYVLHFPRVLHDRRSEIKEVSYDPQYSYKRERYFYDRHYSIKRAGESEQRRFKYCHPEYGGGTVEHSPINYVFGRFTHAHLVVRYELIKGEQDITRNVPTDISLNPNTEKLLFDLLDEGYILSKYERKKVNKLLDYITITLEKPTKYLRASHSRRCVSVINAKKVAVFRIPFSGAIEITKHREYRILKYFQYFFGNHYIYPDPIYSYNIYGNPNHSPANFGEVLYNFEFNHKLHRMFYSSHYHDCRQLYYIFSNHTFRIYLDSDEYGNVYLVKEHRNDVRKAYHEFSHIRSFGAISMQYTKPFPAFFQYDEYPPYNVIPPFDIAGQSPVLTDTNPTDYSPPRYSLDDILITCNSPYKFQTESYHGRCSPIALPILAPFGYDFTNGNKVAYELVPLDYSNFQYNRATIERKPFGDNIVKELLGCEFKLEDPNQIICVPYIDLRTDINEVHISDIPRLLYGKYLVSVYYPVNPPSCDEYYTSVFDLTHTRTKREITSISPTAPVYFRLIPDKVNIDPSKRSKVICV